MRGRPKHPPIPPVVAIPALLFRSPDKGKGRRRHRMIGAAYQHAAWAAIAAVVGGPPHACDMCSPRLDWNGEEASYMGIAPCKYHDPSSKVAKRLARWLRWRDSRGNPFERLDAKDLRAIAKEIARTARAAAAIAVLVDDALAGKDTTGS